MRRLLINASFAAALVAACTTGEKITSISEGMSKAAVVSALGKPDGFQSSEATEVLTYANRLMSGWSWDRADYHVILTDGVVTEYGPGEIRQNQGGRTLLIVPIL